MAEGKKSSRRTTNKSASKKSLPKMPKITDTKEFQDVFLIIDYLDKKIKNIEESDSNKLVKVFKLTMLQFAKLQLEDRAFESKIIKSLEPIRNIGSVIEKLADKIRNIPESLNSEINNEITREHEKRVEIQQQKRVEIQQQNNDSSTDEIQNDEKEKDRVKFFEKLMNALTKIKENTEGLKSFNEKVSGKIKGIFSRGENIFSSFIAFLASPEFFALNLGKAVFSKALQLTGVVVSSLFGALITGIGPIIAVVAKNFLTIAKVGGLVTSLIAFAWDAIDGWLNGASKSSSKVANSIGGLLAGGSMLSSIFKYGGLGATIGAFVGGPVGIIAGALIGAALGALASAIGPEKIANWIQKTYDNILKIVDKFFGTNFYLDETSLKNKSNEIEKIMSEYENSLSSNRMELETINQKIIEATKNGDQALLDNLNERRDVIEKSISRTEASLAMERENFERTRIDLEDVNKKASPFKLLSKLGSLYVDYSNWIVGKMTGLFTTIKDAFNFVKEKVISITEFFKKFVDDIGNIFSTIVSALNPLNAIKAAKNYFFGEDNQKQEISKTVSPDDIMTNSPVIPDNVEKIYQRAKELADASKEKTKAETSKIQPIINMPQTASTTNFSQTNNNQSLITTRPSAKPPYSAFGLYGSP